MNLRNVWLCVSKAVEEKLMHPGSQESVHNLAVIYGKHLDVSESEITYLLERLILTEGRLD